MTNNINLSSPLRTTNIEIYGAPRKKARIGLVGVHPIHFQIDHPVHAITSNAIAGTKRPYKDISMCHIIDGVSDNYVPDLMPYELWQYMIEKLEPKPLNTIAITCKLLYKITCLTRVSLLNNNFPIKKMLMDSNSEEEFLNIYGKNLQSLNLSGIDITVRPHLLNYCPQVKQVTINNTLESNPTNTWRNSYDYTPVFLSHCPVKTLSVLEIKNIRITNANIEFLSKSFPNLKKLSLSNCALTLDHLNVLAKSETLKNIEHLSITDAMSLEKIQSLFTTVFSALSELSLTTSQIDDDCLNPLLNCTSLGNLKTLDISKNRLSVEGVKNLLNSTNMPSLKTIDLTNNLYILTKESTASKKFTVLI